MAQNWRYLPATSFSTSAAMNRSIRSFNCASTSPLFSNLLLDAEQS